MQKISVGKSIAGAYGFLFGRLFPIIGLAWLPALLYAAGSFYVLQNLGAMTPAGRHDVTALAHLGAVFLVTLVVASLLRSVIAISLTQEALGVRKDLSLAHLVVGPRELRLFLALVRLFVLFAVGYAALAGVTAFGIVQAARFATADGKAIMIVNGTSLLPMIVGIAGFLLLVAFVLSILRLSFLIVPIASVEHHASLMRSWSLTRGSAWRIVVIILSVFVPVIILAGCAFWYFSGDALAKAMHDMMAARPRDPKILFQFYATNAFTLAWLTGVLLVVGAALQAGATAAAYRTVTGHEQDDAEDDAALVAPLLTSSEAPAPEGEAVHREPQGDGHEHDTGSAGPSVDPENEPVEVEVQAEPAHALVHASTGEGDQVQTQVHVAHEGHEVPAAGEAQVQPATELHEGEAHAATAGEGHAEHDASAESGVLDTVGLESQPEQAVAA